MLAGAGIAADEVSAAYYFCTERAWGEWVRRAGTLDAKPVLRDLAESLGSGIFLRETECGDCRFCDYTRACPNADVDQAPDKLEDPGPGIQALVRLREHE
jgi:hypothetical protein